METCKFIKYTHRSKYHTAFELNIVWLILVSYNKREASAIRQDETATDIYRKNYLRNR